MLRISKLTKAKIAIMLFNILNNIYAMNNKHLKQNTNYEDISYQNDRVLSDFIRNIEDSEYMKFIKDKIGDKSTEIANLDEIENERNLDEIVNERNLELDYFFSYILNSVGTINCGFSEEGNCKKHYEKMIKDRIKTIKKEDIGYYKIDNMKYCTTDITLVRFTAATRKELNVTVELSEKVKDGIINAIKIDEGNKVFIQSDTEGKLFNILSALYFAGIIKNRIKIVYYDILSGKFVDEKPEGKLYLELRLYEINTDFKNIYIHLGDIVDRCGDRKECLISLLTLLYVKQVLKEKIKLICGNHEIGIFGLESNCCEFLKPLIMLIVFKAIAEGQIVFFDRIKLGEIEYILTHKALFKDDIGFLKNFIISIKKIEIYIKNIIIAKLNSIANQINNKKIEELNSLVNKIEDEVNKIGEINDLGDKNVEKIIEIINTLFKERAQFLFELFDRKKKYSDFYNVACALFNDYNVTKGKIQNDIRFTERERGYLRANQIFGHDHLRYIDAFDSGNNTLGVDNLSETGNHDKSNLYILDKTNGTDVFYLVTSIFKGYYTNRLNSDLIDFEQKINDF